MNLHHPDTLHLRAACGWLELGNHMEANAELENITPEMRAHPDVLELRMEIYARGKLWSHCLTTADALVRICPKKSNGWVKRSFALHEMKRTVEALSALETAAETFPKLWIIPYNLACYCAQLGRLEDSKAWFQKAMAIDEHTVKRKAIDDDDLKPLWDSLNGTMWRKE